MRSKTATRAARIAFELLWTDGHDPRATGIKQDVFVTLRTAPVAAKDWTLELQNDFRATADGDRISEKQLRRAGSASGQKPCPSRLAAA